jgi:diaminohydroxyphosphoribosylaminopyrimidine deaminase/5-amino-6-(5-phosphoribosylamino)uracil reductase
VLDPENSGNYNHAITDTNQTLVINQYQNSVSGNCEWVKVSDCANSLNELMRVLYDRDINSLLVEGGANTLNRFINEKLFDEMTIYKSKKAHLITGVSAPKVNIYSWQSIDWDEDVCCNYSNWIMPPHI